MLNSKSKETWMHSLIYDYLISYRQVLITLNGANHWYSTWDILPSG